MGAHGWWSWPCLEPSLQIHRFGTSLKVMLKEEGLCREVGLDRAVFWGQLAAQWPGCPHFKHLKQFVLFIIPSPTGLTPKSGSRPRRCVLGWPLCDKGLTPICGPTKEANEPPSYVLSLEVSYDKFTSRVLYQLPAHYASAATLQQHVQNRDFPSA